MFTFIMKIDFNFFIHPKLLAMKGIFTLFVLFCCTILYGQSLKNTTENGRPAQLGVQFGLIQSVGTSIDRTSFIPDRNRAVIHEEGLEIMGRLQYNFKQKSSLGAYLGAFAGNYPFNLSVRDNQVDLIDVTVRETAFRDVDLQFFGAAVGLNYAIPIGSTSLILNVGLAPAYFPEFRSFERNRSIESDTETEIGRFSGNLRSSDDGALVMGSEFGISWEVPLGKRINFALQAQQTFSSSLINTQGGDFTYRSDGETEAGVFDIHYNYAAGNIGLFFLLGPVD